jgi:hypothetical protein
MIRVHKTGLDWSATCDQHNTVTWCSNWAAALESAYGHAAMWHKRRRPLFEVWVSDGRHGMRTIGIANEGDA